MESFRKISAEEIRDNVFDLIGKQWMLVSAGSMESEKGYNAMTASWGGAGILWNKPVCFVFVRPQRYTYEFTETNDKMALSFFDEEYRAALRFFGTKSGRDCDKAAECGLTPFDVDGVASFREARMILVCRKLYVDDLKESCFLDPALLQNYAAKDYHRAYICEIESVYVKA